MKLFGKTASAAPTAVQMRSRERHPFSLLEDYVPLDNGAVRLYREMREAVPVIDAAVVKLVRLAGGVQISCPDKRAETAVNEFLKRVNTGRGQRGINSFVDQYLDSLIVCGRAVGEIVLTANRDIAAVICGDAENIEIKEGESPLNFEICAPDETGRIRPLPRQELILFTPFNPESGSPYGVSMLRSMPFMADVLMKIYNTVGVNWERAGNLRYAVVCRPDGEIFDRGGAAERSRRIAEEWSAAMRDTKNGAVRDFVAVGDVEVKVIGADGKIPDSEVPVRQILEQIVARTGIPPFMLGLSWSSTERMSSQQADILTSEITAIRRNVTPVIERIGELWLRLHGFSCPCEAKWDDINLQDESEEAHAELYRAQAEYYRSRVAGRSGDTAEGTENEGN